MGMSNPRPGCEAPGGLVDAGKLKKVAIGAKRVVITWASLVELIEQGAR